jgi:hypothetical protein
VPVNPKLSMKALILASGPDTPRANEIVDTALTEFLYEKIEAQRIDLGGRTIYALLIALDPAHFEAVREDLEASGLKNNLDIAMLEVSKV